MSLAGGSAAAVAAAAAASGRGARRASAGRLSRKLSRPDIHLAELRDVGALLSCCFFCLFSVGVRVSRLEGLQGKGSQGGGVETGRAHGAGRDDEPIDDKHV